MDLSVGVFKMKWLTVIVLITAVTIGGGVTKQTGIEQFWTDDYKVFEQVYGKTSDREIYGQTLPPTLNIGLDVKSQATEKKERFANYQKDIDDYSLIDNPKHTPKRTKKTKQKLNFISNNDFRPISQSSDPETYAYLKHLEELEREKAKVTKFKPQMNYFEPNPEENDAYKSIQDILDAHESNKGNNEAGSSKYLTYRGKNEKNKKKPKVNNNKVSNKRCVRGRCRNRPTPVYRSRPRPYYRTIKKVVKY